MKTDSIFVKNHTKFKDTHLPTRLTVANLAGILDRYVLDIEPICGGMAGSDGMLFGAFRGEGANA